MLGAIGTFISRLVGTLVLLALLALVIGPQLYLEVAGQPMETRIASKEEVIEPLSEGWSRRLSLTLRSASESEPAPDAYGAFQAPLVVAVDRQTFDNLAVGDAVDIRRVDIPLPGGFPALPMIRLESQWPFGNMLALLGDRGAWMLAGIALFFGLLALWSRLKLLPIALAAMAVMVGCVFGYGSGWLPDPPAPLQSAQAEVHDLKLIERVWGGRRTHSQEAMQPFWVVEMVYTPAGRDEPVVVVDLVDDGSVAGLEEGAVLPIHSSVSDPRWAQIDGAQRTYWWKNLSTFAVVGVVVLMLIAFALWRTQRIRARRRP